MLLTLFDQTLKVDFWDNIEQIPTVTVTSIQATFVLVTFVHIRNILVATDLIYLCFEPYKTSIALLVHAQND